MLRSARSAAVFRFPTRSLDRSHSPRAFWLREAFAREAAPEPHALDAPIRADVCIVGGGFTGLWTALEIKRRSPATDVVVLEADVCGGGASGRNGGFAMTWWSKFPSLRKLCGTEAALDLARRSEQAVAEIGRFCDEHAIDASFSAGGWLWTATNAQQVAAWDATIEALDAAGAAPYQPVGRDEVAQRTGSPVHLAGVFEPSVATVQPALLARGLARVAREAGVRIYERTPMSALHAGPVTRVATPHGDVTADVVVLALNAWAARIPEVARGLVVVASDMIATEPIPDRLEQLGWTNGVAVSDSRRLINYYRRSDDGRVVFGKGGGDLALGARIGASFDYSPRRAEQVHAQFRYVYPMLWDVPVAQSWRGPIDYSVSGVPFFSRLHDAPDVIVAAGFSGNGVGPARLAGEIVAEMALDGGDAGLPPALTRVPSAKLPPEPLRYLGGLAVRAAVGRKEDREDLGRPVGPVTRTLAGLDPTSFVDRGPANGANGRAVPSAGANGHPPERQPTGAPR